MYWYLMSEMTMFTCSFIVVKYDVGLLAYPGWSMGFPPSVILVLLVSDFLVLCNILLLNRYILCLLVYFCGG